MSARAARPPSVARSIAAKAITAAASAFLASPASAQFGAAVSLFSDDRFRGYSVSDRHPVAILDLSYDPPSGLYAAASGHAVADDGVRPLSLQLSGGYARSVGSGLSLDVGAVHSNYSRYSDLGPRRSYIEVYVGVAGKLISSRVYFSPDYFDHARTVYGEVDGHLAPGRRFSVRGHVGVLVPLARAGITQAYRADYDWRVGAARAFGRLSAQADWVNGPPRRDRYEAGGSRHNALVFGLSYAL